MTAILERRASLLKRVGEEQRRSGERVVNSLMDTLYREIKTEIELRLEAAPDGESTPDYGRGMQDALDVFRQACRLVKGHEQL